MKNKVLTTFVLAIFCSGLVSPVVSYAAVNPLIVEEATEEVDNQIIDEDLEEEIVAEPTTEPSESEVVAPEETTSSEEIISEPETTEPTQPTETVDSSTEESTENSSSEKEPETTTESSKKPVEKTESSKEKEPIKKQPVTKKDKTPKESVPTENIAEVVAPSEAVENFSLSSDIKFIKNQSTEEFVESIGDKAREVGQEYGLYASVMIAQAILETGSGSSELSQSPNHNLFGIKGSYKGESVRFNTSEDNGKGQLYTVQASFRKYPGYKESFEDYAELLTDKEKGNGKFYEGTLKKNTKSYKEATKYLTGRYATDTLYDKKLNKLIEAYDLTFFDQKLADAGKIQNVYHEVTETDSIDALLDTYGISKENFLKWNKDLANDTKKLTELKRVVVGQNKVSTYRIRNAATQQASEFIIPLKAGYTVSSPFGTRGGEHHNGIDLAISENSAIYASSAGKVSAKGFDPSAGNYVIIEHENGLYTSYFHLNRSTVSLNQGVSMGEMIGYVGSTGNSTGPHLHFAINTELWSGYMNPSNYLEF